MFDGRPGIRPLGGARDPGDLTREDYDAVVIGSGFGGAMAALVLVRAGQRVLMLERGDWVERGPANRSWKLSWNERPGYEPKSPFWAEGESRGQLGRFHCVGGPSVFYGGVGLRMREKDFEGAPEVSGDVRWCISYADLAPDYDLAERLLGIAGDDRADATAPPRARPLPRPLAPLSATSRAVADAARRAGLAPFRLPLALNEGAANAERARCTACDACDGFACAVGAKNDVATALLPRLVAEGMVLRPNTVVGRLEFGGNRVLAAHCVDRHAGTAIRFRGRRFVLAAGALATPHILLASGLQAVNPAGDAVGRHLMRHCNGIVLGAAPAPWGEAADFRKQIGIHDLYFGDPAEERVTGKLGGIQQLRATRIALTMAPLPAAAKEVLNPMLSRLVGLIVMAEDQPQAANQVRLDSRRRDRYGCPTALVRHLHSPRDRAARRTLAGHACRVLEEMGVAFTLKIPVRTFSHALGTVRMGDDPERYPVAPDGRFRGTENLWITDASVFPTSGAVNPSLTISANALRIGRGVAGAPAPPPRRPAVPRSLRAGRGAANVAEPEPTHGRRAWRRTGEEIGSLHAQGDAPMNGAEEPEEEAP